MDPGPPPRPRDEAQHIRPPWSRSGRAVPRLVVQPLQAFLETESAGGVLLLVATLVALSWANSPARASYEAFWHTPLSVGVGDWSLSLDLRHWVNEALMALFFFVVGLEIKREVVTGELRDRRAAVLPAIAALGGMVAPALIYLAFNLDDAGARGWGIPMATDIAFALAVLALVSRHAPPSLRALLLALAIVDDIGAIAVIAVFYSGEVARGALTAALALFVAFLVLQRLHVRWTVAYVILGVCVWIATFQSGLHATIAGAALGLATPAVPFQRPRPVSEEAHRIADETADDPYPPDADAHHWLRLASLSREAVSPLARLVDALHPWTSYVIVPIFALANAGVPLSGSGVVDAATSPVGLGIVFGLILGKPLGIVGAAWVGTKLGLARLPRDVGWPHIVAMSTLAGIGFTVSLFITGLAFPQADLQGTAKVAILGASLLAGLLGGAMLVVLGRRAEVSSSG